MPPPSLRLLLPLLCAAAACVTAASAYATKAPWHRCSNLVPMHGAQPQESEPPFAFSLSRPDYSPGDTVQVTLRGLAGNQFKGFAITARRTTGDTEELVGQFKDFSAQSQGGRWYSEAETVMNCATHNSPGDKSTVTVQWTSPNSSVGDVVFVSPAVQSFKQFWPRVQSTTLRALVPEAAPTTNRLLVYSDVGNASSVDMPGACGTDFGCVGTPAGCNVDSNCQAQMKFAVAASRLRVELMASGQYVAAGFSSDDRMKDDLTVTCTSQREVGIQLGYNPATNYRNERHRWTQLTGSTIRMQQSNYLRCYFTLPLNVRLQTFANSRTDVTPTDKTFDLTQPHYIFMAYGHTFAGTSSASKHIELPAISDKAVNLQSLQYYSAHRIYGYKKGHATLMAIGWIALVPLGTNLAAFYRRLLQKPVWGVQLWFHLHRLLVLSGFVLSVIGMLLMFVASNWTWPASLRTATVHAILGFIVLGLAVGQIIMGLLRPDNDSPRRWLFKILHKNAAIVISSLADATFILIGALSSLPGTYRIIHLVVAITWVVFNTALKVLVPILIGVWDKRDKEATSGVEARQEATRQKVKLLLALYLTGSVALMLVFLISVNIF